MRLRLATLLAALLAGACSHGANHAAAANSAASPNAMPTMLIDARGVTMPLESAVRKIGFRPFIPTPELAAVAVIPPLGGTDTRESRGLALEYDSGGEALLLSEWPQDGFRIASAAWDVTGRPCAPVAFKADGLIWATRNGLVMTLQPDGTLPASRIAHEARRLLASGACR